MKRILMSLLLISLCFGVAFAGKETKLTCDLCKKEIKDNMYWERGIVNNNVWSISAIFTLPDIICKDCVENFVKICEGKKAEANICKKDCIMTPVGESKVLEFNATVAK